MINREKPHWELEPASEERQRLFNAVFHFAENFLTHLPGQKAFVADHYETTKTDSLFEIDESPKSIEQLLSTLDVRMNNCGLNPASGGHLGYIPGGGIYSASLGDYIAAVTNRYAGVFFASPGAVRIENALIRWVGKLIGYTEDFGGNLTSGGSIANIIALSTAKTIKKIKSKEIERTVIYTTRQSHHSIQKALRLIGLDECIIRYIPLDKNFRLEVVEMEKQIASDKADNLIPSIIVTNAGTTDVGAVDPLREIAAIAQRENLWLHVDAAYGGFFLLTEYGKNKLEGIELADSIILDPHKSLFLPYGSGMVMVKNVRHLLEANSYEAGYMQDAREWNQELSPSDLSPELSKHFRGLRMWLPLQLHGVKPFEEYLNEKLALTNYFYHSIQQLGFEVGTAPDLTVALFRFNPKDGNRENFNRNILKKIHNNGRVFISSTEINNEFWLRAAIVSFRTHKKEIDILLELLREGIAS